MRKVKRDEFLINNDEEFSEKEAIQQDGPLIDTTRAMLSDPVHAPGKIRPQSTKRATSNYVRIRSGRPVSVRSRSSHKSGMVCSKENMQKALLVTNAGKFSVDEKARIDAFKNTYKNPIDNLATLKTTVIGGLMGSNYK